MNSEVHGLTEGMEIEGFQLANARFCLDLDMNDPIDLNQVESKLA